MTELMQGKEIWIILMLFEIPTFDMELVSDYFNIEAHFIDSNGNLDSPFYALKKALNILLGNTQVLEVTKNTLLIDILNSQNKEIYLKNIHI